MVPFKLLFENDHGEDHENDNGYGFLYGLQLHQAEWAAIILETDAVCRHLEEIFKKSKPPTDEDNGEQTKVLSP